MEKNYNQKMKELGFDQFVCDLFGTWEDVKDELLVPQRKSGSGNGTVHVFLGNADAFLRKEFADYYLQVEKNNEDPSINAIHICHYFLSSNILSMLGFLCQYNWKNKQEYCAVVEQILEQIQRQNNNGMLMTHSLFKLSLGSSKVRPYFKQFDKDGAFNTVVRQLLLPNSSYKISLYKNEDNAYATFWLIGFNGQSAFDADASLDNLIVATDQRICQEKKLTSFILKCVEFLNGIDGLDAIIPYADKGPINSPIKVSKEGVFSLTGMFIETDINEIQRRNDQHARWFENEFSLGNRHVFLSTQWNSTGDYQLTLTDFEKLIGTCYGNNYYYKKGQNGEHELWEGGTHTNVLKPFLKPIAHLSTSEVLTKYAQYITAIRTKPFVLLAGISGTGKSRIVRELARSCYAVSSNEYKDQVPPNFCMIQVKPNWHDSSELIGYVSRINGEKFVTGPFLHFVAKAWENPDMPHFLCLDEMNLAPVEQYFAEYLSVVESRKLNSGTEIITTDPILPKNKNDWYRVLTAELTEDDELRKQFLEQGITLPQNLIVVGTVNMDETTYSFSRKVLDRAMTIEMNEVDLTGGLQKNVSELGYIDPNYFKSVSVEGCDVYNEHKELCDKVIEYLTAINNILEGTPFKIAYRTRNEFLVYAVNRQWLAGDNADTLQSALDEMTSMKILSRIEGDEAKTKAVLVGLQNLLKTKGFEEKGISRYKITEMLKKLESTDYTGFWS